MTLRKWVTATRSPRRISSSLSRTRWAGPTRLTFAPTPRNGRFRQVKAASSRNLSPCSLSSFFLLGL
eukprot:547-Amorphochlora_amoeboformis.AAC.1